MAKMLPERPRTFDKASLENIMFEALERLPDEYYVIHSFRLVTVQNGTVFESEADFVVYHPGKGIIFLEAKAGHVKYINGEWFYGSGKKMAHDGPYDQADSNKWKFKHYLENTPYEHLLKKCKLLHAVWFPSVTEEELVSTVLPPEADKKITLTKDDLDDPQNKLDAIFALSVPKMIETTLTEKEAIVLLRKVLCPSFDLVPSASVEHDLKKQVFHRMLNEQKCILNYLSEQKTAAIQGVAGTGKTLIALEKARRHADGGERVLFLCYNKPLQDFLSSNNDHPLIDIYTIDGFACKICNTATADYSQLRLRLEDYYLESSFPYDHIIIDEGQDFGQDDIESNSILKLLASIATDKENGAGSMFFFYDSMQFVQGKKIPDYITNADCRLTLYKNCRNTENIATTSLKPIRSQKPLLIDGCLKGPLARLYVAEPDVDNIADKTLEIIKNYEEIGIKDIAVLTCLTEKSSSLSGIVVDGKINGKYVFTTCRKFKGLEADAVIVVDIHKDSLMSEAANIFYVGASRARLYLSLIAQMSETDCNQVLHSYGITTKSKNIKKQLATSLNAALAKF